MLALLRDNEYHAIQLDELLQAEGLEVQSIQTNDPKDVQHLRYPRLRERVVVIVDTDNHEVSLALRGANRASYKIIERVARYQVVHPETKKLPILMKYDEQVAFFEERLDTQGIKFESKEVHKLLIKNLIRTPESYNQLLTLRDSLPDGAKINESHLEDMYEEIEFYNLTQVLVDIILGGFKRKSIKQLQYFTDYKEFSPKWLGDKLRETAVTLDYFYGLVDSGILVSPKRIDDVRDRMRVSGLTIPLELPSLRDQRVYLETIKANRYNQVRPKIQRAIVGLPIVDEVGLYSKVVDLRGGMEDE